MSRKPPKAKPAKTAVVAFKVEEELADLLNKLPNKSAFIRKAIAAQLGVACPLCQGKGVVPRGVHDHYAPLVTRFNSRSCEGCGHELRRAGQQAHRLQHHERRDGHGADRQARVRDVARQRDVIAALVAMA